MSNKELEKLQQLLRKEIQSHQILVTKLKNEPHNTELRKSLHEQQAKITALSERQKKVVEQLRSDLGVKKPASLQDGKNSPLVLTTATQPLAASQHLNIPSRLKQTVIAGSTTKHQLATTPVAATPLASSGVGSGSNGGGGRGSHHLPVTPTRLSIMTNKPSVIKIPNVNISVRLNAMGKKPVAQNLSKELDYMERQYKRQFLSTRPKDTPLPTPYGISGISGTSAIISTSATTTNVITTTQKKPLTAEETKLEFMASIGLVTPKTAETLQSKKSERKRRSTANPQFSKFDKREIESRRSATTYLAAANGWSGEKRRKAARPARFADGIGSENAGINGAIKHDSDGHEDICAVCRQIGELLMCDTCNLVYHLTCLDPPLVNVPPGAWSCPQCQVKAKENPENWHGTLAVVHAFLSHKQRMEEEKKRLGRRANELRMQRIQLEEKATHLNDAITLQGKANESLMKSYRKTEATITQLKDFLSSFQVKTEVPSH